MIQDPIDAAAALRASLARAVDPVVLLLALVGAVGSIAITLALHAVGVRPEHGQVGATYFATIVTSACTLVVTSITFGAITHRVIARERGESLTLGGALAAGFRTLHLVYAAQAVTSIATSVGLALCVLPGIYASIVLAVTSSIAAAERVGPIAAIERSRGLVEGRLGSIAAVIVPVWILVTLVLLGAVTVAAMFVPTAAGGVARYVALVRDVGDLDTPAMIVAITLSRAISAALWGAAAAIVYLRLRAHEEPTEGEKIAKVFA